MGLSAKKVVIGFFTGFLNLLWHDNPSNGRPGPGPDDIEKPKVKEGEAIPVVFGTNDIKAPCVVYFGDVQIDKINESQRTSNYKYSVGMHFILCAGNADRIIRARVDEKTVYITPYTDGTETDELINIDEPGLFGGYSEDGGIVGDIRFEQGFTTQSKNDYLSRAIYGYSGDFTDIPAFRGVTGVVAEGVYIGTAPYVKKWDFRIQRIHYSYMGAAQWNDSVSAIDDVVEKNILEYDDVLYYLLYDEETAAQQPIGHGTPSGVPYAINSYVSTFAEKSFTFVFDYDAIENIVISGMCLGSCKIYIVDGIFEQSFGHMWPRDTYKVYDSEADDSIDDSDLFDFIKTVSCEAYASGEKSLICRVSQSDADSYFYVEMEKQSSLSMNPIHIIRECLTDRDWGLGYSSSDIDSVSFEYAAGILFDEKMGINKIWNRNDITIDDFIHDILRHIDAKLYVEPVTGKYVIKLIREDYTISSLHVLNDSNIKKISNYKKTGFGDLINSVNITYSNLNGNAIGSVIVKDDALIASQGCTIQKTIEYEGFANADISTIAARRELLTLSTQLISLKVESFSSFESIRPGDALVIDSDKYNISDKVFRVYETTEPGPKDKTVIMDCVEDIFTLPPPTLTIMDDVEWVTPISNPSSVEIYFNEEIPYYLLKQIKGEDVVKTILDRHENAGFVCAAAAWPDTGASISAELWTSNTGAAYEYQSEIDLCPWAMLADDISEIESSFTADSTFRSSYLVIGDLFSVGSEIMQIVSFVEDTANREIALVVKRGMLDTVAQKHDSGDGVLFFNNYLSIVGTEYSFTVSIDSKFLVRSSTTIQKLAEVTTSNIWMDSRAYKPYLPGNLKVNGEYFPEAIEGELVLTWAHRNRGSSTLHGFTDASVTSESGVTYTLRIYDEDDTLVLTETGITAETYTYSTESGVNNSLRFELESVRDGYSSFYMYDHTVNRAGFGLQFGRYFGGI